MVEKTVTKPEKGFCEREREFGIPKKTAGKFDGPFWEKTMCQNGSGYFDPDLKAFKIGLSRNCYPVSPLPLAIIRYLPAKYLVGLFRPGKVLVLLLTRLDRRKVK